MTQDAYAQAGVNTDVEARASAIMYEASKKTYRNRSGRIGGIKTLFDDFAGLRVIPVDRLPKGSVMSWGFDGAGTKVILPQRLNSHSTIGIDLMAMLCDDAVLRGGEPAIVGSVLDIKSFGDDDRFLPIVQSLADGSVTGADAANVAIFNGEIAQMGACISGYGDFPFNWAGACIWFAREEKLFTGREIKPGDSIVALAEKAFRCNGLSLVRKTFEQHYGPDWHAAAFAKSTIGALSMHPSTIYSRAIVEMHGGFAGEGYCEVHGIAHITGGGIPEKLGRVLRPTGYGAQLDNLFEPPLIMSHCQVVGKFDDRNFYKAFNGGQGMFVITPDSGAVIRCANAFGIGAQRCGVITEQPGIKLHSKAAMTPGAILNF